MTSNTKKTSVSILFLFTLVILSPIKTFAETQDQTIELETGFYYTVEKGDTLWDLSQRFSNSPWVWPELWGDNQDIRNPHLIYPGQKIKLYLRKDMENVEIPVPKPEPEPEEIKEPEPIMPTYYYPKIDSVGFFKPKAVEPSATIFEVKNNKAMISQGDIVYIRALNDTAFFPGARFFIYKTYKPVKRDKKNFGVQHYILGIVEVTKVEPNFALAKVTKSFRTININDSLMPYIKRTPNIKMTESVKGLEGEIIVSEEGSNYFGDNSIAFIDKGKNDGVEDGQMYSIYYQDVSDFSGKKNVLLTPMEFGNIFVLHTERDTSTVLITYSQKSITPGSKIHAQAD